YVPPSAAIAGLLRPKQRRRRALAPFCHGALLSLQVLSPDKSLLARVSLLLSPYSRCGSICRGDQLAREPADLVPQLCWPDDDERTPDAHRDAHDRAGYEAQIVPLRAQQDAKIRRFEVRGVRGHARPGLSQRRLEQHLELEAP